MRLPPTCSRALPGGARLVQVDWPDAPFLEIRIVLPFFRHSPREATHADVLARLLGVSPSDAGAADAADRLLSRGAMLTTGGAVDRVSASLTVPAEHAEEVVSDLLAHLQAPRFTPPAVSEAVAQARARAAAAAGHRETALTGALLRQRWGTEHPYVHAVPDPDHLADIDASSLALLADQRLTRRGAAIVVVGDLGTRGGKDWGGLPDRLGELFATARLPGDAVPGPTDPGPRGASLVVTTPGRQPTESYRLWAPAPVREHPDHPALHVFSLCLGGFFGSRLVRELRERRGDVYGVTTGFEVLATAVAHVVMLECAPDRLASVRSGVADAVEDLRTAGPTEHELAAAVRYATHAATVGISGPAALATAGASVVFAGDTFDLWRRQAAAVARLTPDDVARAGARYLGPDALIEAVTAGQQGC